MYRYRLVVWLLIGTLALPMVPAAGAQEETVQSTGIRPIGGLTFAEEIELTIANLVVYVTDKKGRAVTDLTADDFEVFQDGDQKQITNFKLYTDEIIRSELKEEPLPGIPLPTPATDPATDPAVDSGPVPVHLVLYIDNENLQPLDRNRVLSQTRDFVRTSLHPPARMMVVAYQRSFEVLQEFTSEPADVLNALRKVRTYTGGRTERMNTARDIIDRIQNIEKEQNSDSPYANPQGGVSEYNQVYQLIANYARESTNDLQFTLDYLRQTITTLSGLPGKKGVIYVSNGLPMTPGMELFYEMSRVTRDSTILTRMYEFDASRYYQQLAAMANAQDVTFYAIDATGLTMGGIGGAEYATAQDPMAASVGMHNLTDSLRFLADETGGIAIVSTNDVAPRLELITQDMFTYYSLGYPLQVSGQDKVHRIKVTLREDPAFSDYELRYRSRFVEKSLETNIQDAVVSSLAYEIDDNPMELEVTTGTPAPASEKRWLLPTHISFPLEKVALLPEGDDFVARLVFFIAARDTDGKRSDLVRQEYEVRIPAADYEEARTRRWGLDTQLLMESGRYRISVALLDPLTRQDSYETISTSVNPK